MLRSMVGNRAAGRPLENARLVRPRSAAGAAARGGPASSSLVLPEECVNDLIDLVLLAAWELGEVFDEFVSARDGTGPVAFGLCTDVEEVFHGDAQRMCEAGEHVRAWRMVAGFPVSNVAVGFLDEAGELHL